MPSAVKYNCDWYDDGKTILVIRALTQWDWKDIDSALTEQMNCVRSVKHSVYTIYDLSATPVIPKGLALPNLKRVTSERQPNQRLTIYVGMGFLQERLMEMTNTAFNLQELFKNFHFARTMDEALAIIEADKRRFQNV
mgnify:CR=1 FL=1